MLNTCHGLQPPVKSTMKNRVELECGKFSTRVKCVVENTRKGKKKENEKAAKEVGEGG